ncbi:MAG: transporter [Bacteroidales bacterium]
MITFLRNWMLPIAMFAGIIFYSFFSRLTAVTPYLIFSMLFLTFSKLSPKELKFRKLHFKLLAMQLGMAAAGWLTFACFNTDLANSALICFLAPTATAAAVVTGLLGGSVPFITGYVFLTNAVVAISAPFLFSYIGEMTDLPFHSSVWLICKEVIPLLILPLLSAWAIRFTSPKALNYIQSLHGLSLYIWAFALMIVVGKTVNYLIHQDKPDYLLEILIALISLTTCCLQFALGRWIGGKENETITGGQSLGQKNTILAIWLSHMYINPLVAIAPATYVLWQNCINSYQLWKKRRN